ncbi:ATP-binding protein [Massilia luteola]|uniref:ATP-binding protein n=1 Tax=Massilia luteola TaxID=3081751 RepID=UPI002ACBDCAE|nr:winged helix-turn-helix domain-containing protein [Massilia sp. Gc5]
MNAGHATFHARAADPAPVLAFGPFRLHAEPLRLCRHDEEVRLGGRALALLLALVSRPGEVLGRSALEAQVWPCSVVEDSSLRVHVAALRRALGDGVDGARYIANIPGRGYSFVAAVTRIGIEAAAPAAGPPDRMNNLPTSLERLLGRDASLATLSAALARRRLVSIVGHGGIGKTSLALALAAQVQERYPDGVCFVDLSPLTAPSHVAETVVAALGLPMPSESHIGALEAWLRQRRLLLVLDNCEHLLDAVAGLVERILRRAPGLVVLTTSREPLDADGEWVHRIPPLETPPDGPPLDSAEALGFAAVQLLAERAVASLDAFAIDGGNVHLASALCRRLDGVPLAIEFAASRIGLLGLQGVCAQLDDRLRLLGSGRRTAVPRHRTLRALLEWSHDLLTAQQQRVLRRCGVFRGEFALEAADAVIADATLPPDTVRDCLLDLVAKSMVRVDLAQSPPRYSLLEITRAYALDRLDADPDRHAVSRRHAEYMVVLVRRRASEGSETLPQQSFLFYASHVANFRAALEWCFGPDGDPAIGIALVATDYYPMALYLGENEYRMRAGQALAAIRAGTPADPRHEVRIFSVLHYFAAVDGDQPALDRLQRAAEQDEDAGTRFEALSQLHSHNFGRGNYHLCEPLSRRSEEAAGRCGMAEMLHARRLRALASHYCGRHAAAAEYGAGLLRNDDQCVPLNLSGWLSRKLSMQIVMARVFWMQGQGRQATALAESCVRDAADARFPAALSQAICLAALPIALWQGDDALAQTLLRQLDAHLVRHPQKYWAAWLDDLQQVMALRAVPPVLITRMQETPDAKLLDHLVTFGAWGYLDSAVERWRLGMVAWNGPELLRIQGELIRRDDTVDRRGEAEALFAHGLALATEQQAHAWALRLANSMARMRLAQGRPADARAVLWPWLGRLDMLGNSVDARETRVLLDRR